MDKEGLGARLLLALRDCGMTQQDLSNRARIPYRSVQHYTKGTQSPGVEALEKIRIATGINTDWLLTGEGEQFVDKEKMKPRPMELADIRELKTRFTDFDQYFTMLIPGLGPQQIDQRMIDGFRQQLKMMWQQPGLSADLQRIREAAHPGFAKLQIDALSDDEVMALFTRLMKAMKAHDDDAGGAPAGSKARAKALA
jgi:transcriptional regulator with XRE-family HTH domain